MGSYTIGQVAARSGISSTALRYYEGIGLVPPAGRSTGGYRQYDDETLSRLAFIARAKQLGCTLEEITDLVEVWNGDRCGPVQRRLHELVTAKLRAVDRQIVELTEFSDQLRVTARRLGEAPVDGPCDDDCACLHDPAATSATSVTSAASVGRPPDEEPIACTLGSAEMGDRLQQWNGVLASATGRRPLPSGGLRIELGAVDIADLVRLVEAEQACCGFFQFAITVDQRGVALEVGAPLGAQDLVTGLFGDAGERDGSLRRLRGEPSV
jgi:DNA-binding transcriptional MerR regulator